MVCKNLIGAFCSMALLVSAADTRLSEAALRGDTETVKSLLKQHVDVDAPQGDGTTALHWAAFHDDLAMVNLLLSAGANVRAATREGAITPLFLACTNGNAPVIEALIKGGADANSTKANGTTALMTAAASGSVDAVKVLLKNGARVNDKESAHGQTALMFAAALNRDAVIRELMANGAGANLVSSVSKIERVRFDQDGNIVEDRPAPAAGAAAANGAANPGATGGRGGRRGAAAQEAAPKAPETKPGETAGAAADARDEAADAQAAAEALKTANEAAKADLDIFSSKLGFKSAEYLLAKARAQAGDVANRAPRRVGPEFAGGNTALLYAAREGHMAAVRALVESGADVNVLSADKFSPMIIAITNGHLDVAKYLLDHKADPKVVTVSGLTALYAVIDVQWAPHAWFPQPATEQEKISYIDLMKDLLDKGADINAPIGEKLWFRSFTNDFTWVDPGGSTPFWRAAQASDIVAMKFLIAHGADPKINTKSGTTPLMAATGIGWAASWSVNAPYPLIDAVKYCVELGNDVNAAENRGYTALHGAAYLGNNEMVNYLVSKGAKIDAVTKAGDTIADMANGPTRFGQPHLETVALLEKLGSINSHNCRSDQCVVATKPSAKDRPLTVAERGEKAILDKFAGALGFKESVYLADAPVARGVPGSQQQ
jgi:ankyrin repeat protein